MCLSLAPFPECGYGTCVNASCVCDEGFEPSDENFYLLREPGQIRFCGYNRVFITTTATTLLCYTLLTLLIQTYVIQNFKQAKRIAPTIVGYILLVVALMYLLLTGEADLFGIDILYTFCFVSSITVLSIGQLIFVHKYLAYLGRSFDFATSYQHFTELTRLVHNFLAAVLLIAGTVWISSCFTADLTMQRNIVVTALSLFLASFTYTTVSSAILFYKFHHDLKSLSEQAKNNDKTKHGNTPFINRCKRQIPRVKVFGIASVCSSIVCWLTCVAAVSLPGILKELHPQLMLTFFWYETVALTIIRANSKKPLPCGEREPQGRNSLRFSETIKIASSTRVKSSEWLSPPLVSALKSRTGRDSQGHRLGRISL